MKRLLALLFLCACTSTSTPQPVQSLVDSPDNHAIGLVVSNADYSVASFIDTTPDCIPWVPINFTLQPGTYENMQAQVGNFQCGYVLSASLSINPTLANTCYLRWSGAGGMFLIQQGDNTACNYFFNTDEDFVFIYQTK